MTLGGKPHCLASHIIGLDRILGSKLTSKMRSRHGPEFENVQMRSCTERINAVHDPELLSLSIWFFMDRR